jgi:hypothetical protein
MNKFKTMRAMPLLAGGALLMLANLAQAQYMWVDAKGVKQFSDRPPPASVPLKDVLKAPGRTSIANTPEQTAQKPAAAAPALAPKTLADREADFRKRQAETASAEAKAETAAAEQGQHKADCDTAKARNAALASGKRVRTPDNTFLDDKGRAEQQANMNQVLAKCN